MPRTIKKKLPKEKKTQPGGDAVYNELRETIAARRKSVLALSMAALAVIVIAAGIYFYHRSTVNTAGRDNAQGYALFYGLSPQAPAPPQRYVLAMSFFQKAYAARKSAYSLYYIGASQAALGQDAQALGTFEKVYTDYSGDAQFVPLALYRSAMTALQMGNNAGARKYLAMMEGSSFDSLKDMAYYEDARILESMGKTQEAGRKADELIRQFPESPFAQDFKAQRAAAQAPAPAQAGNKNKTGKAAQPKGK